MTGSETRYATDVALLIEEGRVVGVRGHNDRGLSFALRAVGEVDLSGSGTYDIEALPGGVSYDECSGGTTPEQCVWATGRRKLRLLASGGTLVIEATASTHRASFELRGVRKLEPSAGEAQARGCFQVSAPANDEGKDAGAD